MILDTALGFFVQGPEIHDEFRPGAQDCPQVCCQALGVVSPAVPGWGGSPAGLVVVVVVELLLPGGEPVEQRGAGTWYTASRYCRSPHPTAERSAVIGGEPDDHREGLVPTEIIIAGMPPGILAHGRSFFHRAV